MGPYSVTSAMSAVFGIGVVFEIFLTLGTLKGLIEKLKMYVSGFTTRWAHALYTQEEI